MSINRKLVSALAIATAVVGLTAVATEANAAPADIPAGAGCMNSGQSLGWNQSLNSSNGTQLTMQPDGNAVLYAPGHRALWSTGTNGRGGDTAVQQSDGNFVVYNGDHQALWASNTANNAGAPLCVQNDGNLVIYGGGIHPVWATNTHE